MATHQFVGHLVDKSGELFLQNYRVEALDCQRVVRTAVAAGWTDDDGNFTLNVNDATLRKQFGSRKVKLFFRVTLDADLVTETDQTQHWSPQGRQTGTIEIDTQSSIGPNPSPNAHIVRGVVVDTAGEPLPVETAIVELWVRDLTSAGTTEAKVAEVDPGNRGRYELAYVGPGGSSTRDGEIILRVRQTGDVVASRTVRNPPSIATVDIVVGAEEGTANRGRTQYATLVQQVEAAVAHTDPVVEISALTEAQVELLSSSIRQSAERIQQLVDAAQLADEHGTIDREVFFALITQGLPTETEELFAHRVPTLMRAIASSASVRTVAPDLAETAGLEAALEAVAVATLRIPNPDGMRLGVLVDDAPDVTEPEATAFIKKALNHTGSSRSFWEAVDGDVAFSADAKKALRFAVDASALSGAFFPVVQILHERVADSGDPLEADAKMLAEYTVANWRSLIDEIAEAPRYPADTLEGDEEADDDDRRDAYAAVLAANVERRFRTAVVSARIRAAMPTEDIATFFTDNDGFDFLKTRVDKYVFENATALDNVDAEDRPALVEQLKQYERVVRVTESYAETSAVIGAGYTSARAIDEVDPDKFAADIAGAGISADRAKEIHERACWTSAATTALKVAYAPDTEKATFQAVPDMSTSLSQEALEEHGLADWTTLFGSPDACLCEHCRSVLGPAAYLADVLQLLKKVGADPSGTARDVVFDRRPDLPKLALSCANGDTALPYVDLVNEILEVKVAAPVTWPDSPAHVDTSLTTDELLAQPEIIYPDAYVDAYTTLEAAVYPFQLPFNVWQEEARVYLKHLGVSRGELLRAFAPAAGADARDLALERLGTTGRQFDIIAGPPSGMSDPTVADYWGLANAATLSSVKVLLEQSGLSFEELQELLATKFATDGGIALEDDPPCDVNQLDLVGLNTDGERHFIHRMLRLRQVLGWSISDIDRAHIALGSFDNAALQQLGAIRELQALTGEAVAPLLAYYASMDRQGGYEPSLFERVFLDKRVSAPADAVFASVFAGGSPTDNIEDVSAGLSAALKLNRAELSLLVGTGAADSMALSPVVAGSLDVSLERLSRLYRVVAFARRNGLGIAELMLKHALCAAEALAGDAGSPSPQGTLDFLDKLKRIEELPFTLEEIHYLLRHVAPDDSPLLLDGEGQLTPYVAEIDALVALAVEAAAIVDDPKGELMDRLVADIIKKGLLAEADAARVQELVVDPNGMSSPNAEDFLHSTLAPFLAGTDVEDAIDFLVPAGAIPVDAHPERYTYLARRFQQYFGARSVVVSWVAQQFDIEEAAAASLLERMVSFDSEPAIRAFVPVSAPTLTSTGAERKELLVRVQKASMFAGRFALTAPEIDAMYGGGSLPAVGFSTLPIVRPSAGAIDSGVQTDFAAMLRVGDYVGLRGRVVGGAPGLLSVFTFAETAPNVASVIAVLAARAGWNAADLTALAGSGVLNLGVADFEDERALVRLDRALDLLKRLGVPASIATQWLNVEAAAPTLPLPGVASNAFTIARDIRRAARAKHDEAGWKEVARPLRNAIREKQRDALVGYLMAEANMTDPNQLYEELLIDVQMDPCALTSRLVQAHSSCQMFIQRVQMNLEQDSGLSPSDRLATQWRWMKNYRVWEANRKVFLWPENWIEPALRDDKTPLFEELERTLLSGPVTHEAAEEAYRRYLDGLADLSNLEIVAMHVENRKNDQLKSGDTATIVHVFGRTRKSHVYYYRNRLRGQWSAWEKVDASIEGEHLMPFTFGGRLYIAWAIMEEVDKTDLETLDEGTPPANTEQLIAEKAHQLGIAAANEQWDEVKQLTQDLKDLKAQQDQQQTPDVLTPPKLDLSVRVAVSEYRAGSWTTPMESAAKSIGASVFRPALSFVTQISAQFVDTTLQLFGRFPLLRYRFYPGTSTHSVSESLNGLWDPLGGYGAQISPVVQLPANTGNAPTLPTTEGFSFGVLSYQAFGAPGSGNELRLYLVESGNPNPEAVILESGVSGTTRLIVPRGPEAANERRHAILQDRARSFVMDLRNRSSLESAVVFSDTSSADPHLGYGDREYRIEPFYHPYVNTFRHAVAAGRLDALLRPANQLNGGLQYQQLDLTENGYVPNEDNVNMSLPVLLEEVDFRHGSAFGVYNWELFFHVPLLIADYLKSEGRYEEAQRWLHYVFDPTDGTNGATPQRYWKFKPFADNKSLAQIQDELDNLTMSTYAQEVLQIASGDFDSAAADQLAKQIVQWRFNPFEPHLLARMRTVAYQKCVVMRYIDNLIAWADSLFARDSIESINEAAQLYVFALSILGPKPNLLPEPEPPEVQSYEELDILSAFDAFSNAIVGTEVLAPPPPKDSSQDCRGHEPPPMIIWGSPYFCIPVNEKLLGYWDTVADRLFKIRNCMNIEGVARVLPLFEPPIDPALLVRATAAGVDISSVLFDINVAAPLYRYGVLFGKAVEFASQVASLGASLLSALEKGDAEELSDMRQRHEVTTQKLVLDVRRAQVKEAQENLRATERSLVMAKTRLDYYSSREEINAGEEASLALRAVAQASTFAGQQLHAASGSAALVPQITIGIAGVAASPIEINTFGGAQVNASMQGAAKAVEATGIALNTAADVVGTLASYRRRKDDWDHQAQLAQREIAQIERQIEAATLRVEIARHELQTVQTQIRQSEEVARFLQRKFTNRDLYGWLKVELARLHYQAYKLAFEMARRAEKAFQYERGDMGQAFIEFGHWDSMRKGMLAGERLLLQLRRMDAAYLGQKERELELVKVVSLAEHDPRELVKLRDGLAADILFTEDDYDRDFNTHYLRRFKSIGITVPCTSGPFQGVLGTLTSLQGETRRANDVIDTTPSVSQSIATSHAQADAGLFELQFRDERLLPFEGVGAHATAGDQLRFELSGGNRFNYDTIDDLVFDVRYTARGGGSPRAMPSPREFSRLIRVRDEFPAEWRAFKTGELSSISMTLATSSFALTADETKKLDDEDLELEIAAAQLEAYFGAEQSVGAASLVAPSGPTPWTLSGGASSSRRGSWSGAGASGTGTFVLAFADLTSEERASMRDLWLIVDYTLTELP